MTAPVARIAVFGAGRIGGYLGGRLAGHAPVTLIGRSHVGEALAARGLQVSAWDGYASRLTPDRFTFTDAPGAAGEADLILVTVKSGGTAEAGRQLASTIKPGAIVISFQNGLRNADLLSAALPDARVLAGMVPYNVTRPAPGHFHQATSGELMVRDDDALRPFLPLFADAGIPLRPRADMRQVQAGKLLLNLNNAINALADIPLREQLAQRDWRRCLALAQDEALRVFAAAGIRPARVTPLPPAWLPALLRLPDALFTRIAARMLRIDPLARSSMWDDLQACRHTEVDWIQGEIVELATRRGLAAPVNAALTRLIHEAGQARRIWSAAQLHQALLEARRRDPEATG